LLRLRAEEAGDPVEDVGRELRPKLGL
jgi:hypothetical protein